MDLRQQRPTKAYLFICHSLAFLCFTFLLSIALKFHFEFDSLETICFTCFNESPLKMMKLLFFMPYKLFPSSRYLNFCLDLLVM